MPHTTTDHNASVLLLQLAEMYCSFQVDPHDAAIASSQRDHGERTGLMLTCRKTQRRLAIVARSLRVKGPQFAQALERDGEDSSVLRSLIHRIEEGPASAADALECARKLRVQLERRLRRGAGPPAEAADERIGPGEAAKRWCRGVSWWRQHAADGNLDADRSGGPNGSYTFTAASAAALAKAKNIDPRR